MVCSGGPLAFIHPADGFMRQLAAALEIQLRFDPGPIGIDRTDSEAESSADFPGALPLPYELKNLQFAISQLRHTALWLHPAGEALQHPCRHPRPQINLACRHL